MPGWVIWKYYWIVHANLPSLWAIGLCTHCQAEGHGQSKWHQRLIHSGWHSFRVSIWNLVHGVNQVRFSAWAWAGHLGKTLISVLLLTALLSISCELVLNLALAPSSTSVPFTLTTVQVLNIALTHKKQITVRADNTVIRFVWFSAKFGTCTVVSVNGTLVEDKCMDSRVNVHILASKSVPFTLTTVSAKFSTNSQETDNSEEATFNGITTFSYLEFTVLKIGQDRGHYS